MEYIMFRTCGLREKFIAQVERKTNTKFNLVKMVESPSYEYETMIDNAGRLRWRYHHESYWRFIMRANSNLVYEFETDNEARLWFSLNL